MHQAILQHVLIIHLLFHGAIRNSIHLSNCLFHIFGHEFHRSHLITNSPQPLFNTYRYDCDEHTGFEGWYLPNVHASYIHQHWGESREIPQRFIQECLNPSEK